MSLQDESFPADDLFDKLNATAASQGTSLSYQRQYALDLDDPDNLERHPSPFLNSDCSEKTCASDPVGLEHDHNQPKHENAASNKGHHADRHIQLGSGRSSKAVSYQDIHSAYTKRRYKHVTSKVSKYIADINDQEKQRRTTAGTFQRHRSMPESLTPRGGAEDQQKLDESLTNSSGTDQHMRDESYERLINEKESLQWHNKMLEKQLYERIDANILLRNNFELIRTELTDCKDKLKRQTALVVSGAGHAFGAGGHSVRSQIYCHALPNVRVTKATQTDLPVITGHMSNLSDLSDMPAIAANATPHPNANLHDLTYDSSAGSIEIPLLSVPPAIRQPKLTKSLKKSGHIKPLSLNFSNDSADVDAHGHAAGEDVNGNLQPTSSNRATTNNSGSSHPSSNDSAIDIEGHELRSPQPKFGHQAINFAPMLNWSQREGIICFEKTSNRVMELVPLNTHEPDNGNTNTNNSSSSISQFSMQQYRTYAHIGQRKRSLAARMLRLFGPCARCDDPNQMDASNATYTVGIPLLPNDSTRSHNLR
ncbi:protein swallow [Drosophila novamexicana]|uniref:protein swallow n=1 Tax=Drosophila novamexicana TaxID=47314 RepID=UPI0011E5ACA6|nr:protein swallow [Drosophila novamexicana]